MPSDTFDIYQGPTGPTAVTNPVQRQILGALAEGERQLPELVELTGRSKPTLSGSHMKELLNRELIIEHPHPTDSRRKVYRLNARALGSSEVPVDDLRRAVQSYAQSTTTGLPLAASFQALAAAPARTSDGILLSQAQALGELCAPRIPATDARAFAVAFSQFVEREGLAEHLQLDFEALSFRCRPGASAKGVDSGRMGLLLAGFAQGAAAGNGLTEVRFASRAEGDAFRLRPA